MRLVEGGDLKRRIAADGPLPPARSGRAARPGRRRARRRPRGRASSTATSSPTTSCSRATAPTSPTSASPRRSATAACSSGASIAGTVEYMSPEQWQGRSVGPAADVYSLGCVLYEALTGIVPYARQADDTEPEMPAGLDAVIERAVAKDPDRRYPTAGGADRRRPRARGRDAGRDPGALRHPRPADRGDRQPRGAVRWASALGRGPAPALGRDLDPRRALRRSSARALLLLGGDGVSVSAPIAVGQGPLRIATGERSVWVTSARDGTLTRIDPASGLVAGRPLRLGRGIAGVAVGARLGLGREPAHRRGPADRRRQRHGSRTDRRSAGARAPIVFGGDRVWVADEDGAGVTAINARGRQGLQARDRPARRAAAPRGRRRRRLGQQRRRPARCGGSTSAAPSPGRRSSSAAGPPGVTVGGGIVWVANSRSDSVTRVDPATRALLGEPIAVGGRPGRDRRRHQRRLGRQRRRRQRQPDRHRKRRDGRRPDRRRPPPGRRRGRRAKPSGSPTTATAR